MKPNDFRIYLWRESYTSLNVTRETLDEVAAEQAHT